MLDAGSKILLCYLVGSIMGSMIMGFLRGGVDIRTMGSGNAGSTNALRTQGWLFAVGVIVIDVGKGVAATVAALLTSNVSRLWLCDTAIPKPITLQNQMLPCGPSR